MITVKMSVEEFHMMIVALQNTASGCEQTAAVFEANGPRTEWKAVSSREMAFKYNQMADAFREQAKEEGW